MRRILPRLLAVLPLSVLAPTGHAAYVNFEVSHVHPVDLTPSGNRLLAVNTPDALLEVFTVEADGSLTAAASIPVGLEPVTVVARNDGEAWVVNNLSDSVSVVDLNLGATVKTIFVGDEPTDVGFTASRAFVSVSSEDTIKVYDLSNLASPPTVVPLFGRDVRALALSTNGQTVYAVVFRSGNQTTIAGVRQTFPDSQAPIFLQGLDPARLAAMGLRNLDCHPRPYPPLPAGITRNPALDDPPDDIPKVGLIVRWDGVAGKWLDEAGEDWGNCLPYTLADSDLFIMDASTLAVTEVAHLGTTLFDVSVHPGGKIYVPNTDAQNFVRFEHPLGVQGRSVENQLSIVDPASDNAVTRIDLNMHINRASNPATNLAERQASISQPGMLVWNSAGTAGYLTAIGSRKLFRVSGSCLSGTCIFGADRSVPDAVEVGEGPTGVALREIGSPDDHRLYVLNRISHSISVVKAATLEKLAEIPLHDPSSEPTRSGRRFLYDAIDTSGHGDAACSSCHPSGDMDGLAWDIGNPEEDLAPYAAPLDNVRFIAPTNGLNGPEECDPRICAVHLGFDPQKGPMITQTLRGMLEPLHWRGDRPTMNDFNKTFVGLMGTADIGPINGTAAGLSAADMEKFRQFALEIRFPPNPFRNVDDTTPCGPRSIDPTCEVLPHGALLPGNPTEGARLFADVETFFRFSSCTGCHTHPFGAAGGQLGGVQPTEPASSTAAGMHHGDADGSPHSDLKVPHLRNLYEKFGPVWAAPGDNSKPPTKTGFGYIHDGGMPDLYRFLSKGMFDLSPNDQAQEVRDLVSFMFHFSTETKPAVGRQVTLPPGTPPTGPVSDESMLSTLIGLGDLANSGRHCELVAWAISGGRLRAYHLSGGSWVTDVTGESPVTLQALREGASSPITFTCATVGAGHRLGGDRDEDLVLNGDDCAPADADTLAVASPVIDLRLALHPSGHELIWTGQAATTGPSIRYDVLGGDLAELHASGIVSTDCLVDGLAVPSHVYENTPAPGDGTYFLIRAVNPCGVASLGPGREPLETLTCP